MTHSAFPNGGGWNLAFMNRESDNAAKVFFQIIQHTPKSTQNYLIIQGETLAIFFQTKIARDHIAIKTNCKGCILRLLNRTNFTESLPHSQSNNGCISFCQGDAFKGKSNYFSGSSSANNTNPDIKNQIHVKELISWNR